MLSALSNRLVISEQQMQEQKRWGYQANETGHEGTYMKNIHKIAKYKNQMNTMWHNTTGVCSDKHNSLLMSGQRCGLRNLQADKQLKASNLF